MTVKVKPDELPILLSQQISPDTPIRVIGLVQGSRNDRNYATAYESARDAMLEEVRKMGGQVIIDPQIFQPVSVDSDTKVLFTVCCKVGVFTSNEVHGESQ
jgi:hypothetical protein